MMKRKNRLLMVVAVTFLFVTLSACGNGQKNSKDSSEKTTITFWTAPNPTQLKYWKKMAANFEKANKNIKVEVSQMKESPSSEATIQSAVASKTAPTLSENINRSFAAQLADSKAILPFNKEDTFSKIVTNRKMTESIKNWQFSDKNQYVLPLYSNPILFGWRLDVLSELGYSEPPKTYSELLELGKKLKAKYPNKVLWAKADGDLADPTAWMRWFDFFPLYDAASGGANFIENNKLVADDKAGKAVFNLMSDLQKDKLLLTSKSTDPFENKVSVMIDLGPWTFPNWKEKYPELKFGENYTVTTPVVPDAMKDKAEISTYADAKGIVLYAQASDQEQAAAMKFLDFVFGDEKNDLAFLETTSLIPARDDATENPTFAKYFEENPEMEVYAENVKNAVPAMDNAEYNDLQQILGEKGWVPVVRGESKPDTAWKDMKNALKGALQ